MGNSGKGGFFEAFQMKLEHARHFFAYR